MEIPMYIKREFKPIKMLHEERYQGSIKSTYMHGKKFTKERDIKKI